MRRWIVFLFVVAACGGQGSGTTPDYPDVSSLTRTSSTAAVVVPRQLVGLEIVTLEVGDREMVLAVADTTALRTTGLMFVTDLDDLDGMVFVFAADTTTTFHMENTFLPLDIAFFGADGAFVSKTTMTPCFVDECPSYSAEAGYRYSIEVPAGGFEWVNEATVLDPSPLLN